jgi:hypothetical protein
MPPLHSCGVILGIYTAQAIGLEATCWRVDALDQRGPPFVPG